MEKCLTVRTGSSIAGLLASLAFSWPALATDLNVPAQHATIQAAVDAAAAGDTIHIAPGIYTEQVTILRKKLTLIGSPGTVMRARTGMTQTLRAIGGAPNIAVLGIALSDVVVRGITFEGEHLAYSAPDESELVGIYLWGSSGLVTNCTVMGFRENPSLGNNKGTGIKAGNHTDLGTPPVRVQVLNCTLADNCQSIVCYGTHGQPDLVRVMFTIQDNVITGIGPTDLGAQFGIGIGPSATGDVRRNVVTDHSYTGRELLFSSGINAQGNGLESGEHIQPVRYEGNTLRNNQLGLNSLLSHGSQYVKNTFLGPGTGYRSHGLVIVGLDNQVLDPKSGG